MPFDGGYYLLNQDLMRGGMHKHTTAFPEAISDTMLDAVNTIQATPWRINTWILDLIRECWTGGDVLAGLPAPDDEETPPEVPVETWLAMGPKERALLKHTRALIHERNAQSISKREALLRKMNVAEELRGEESIWFPHSLDFRGRLYAMTQDLNPQGDDIAKALIMFSEGKPLGEDGLYWLGIRLANAYGQDKLSFQERTAWVKEHHDLILDSAYDPLDGRRFWAAVDVNGDLVADEPWSFLATCREYAMALEGKPSEFVSHLPIPLDGTCNGIQHLALMGRDTRGAVSTNCAALDERQDLYAEVAEIVTKLVNADVVAGGENAEALAWAAQGISRKTVKSAVMTTPYGVTQRGIRDQLIKGGFTDDLEGSKALNAQYLQRKIAEALGQTVESSRDIMAYFQGVAQALAEKNIPLRWKTPAGMEVHQSYYNLVRKKVQTLEGELVLWNEDPEVGLNKRKQARASAPNIIHSFDAAMLALTALRCLDEHDITSFAFIHDSYGTHAADTSKLAKTLRDVAAEMYAVDRLAEFETYVRSYALDIELPPRPELGSFNVDEVRSAPYFFA